MTTQAALGSQRPPQDDSEWARLTQRRLERLENPTTQRIGGWVLSQEEGTGDLLASHVDGGSIRVARVPQAIDDADTVTSGSLHIKLRHSSTASASPIVWESSDFAVGSWGLTTPTDTVTVPTTGVWTVNLVVTQVTQNSSDRTGWITVNGNRMVEVTQSWGDVLAVAAQSTIIITDSFLLTEGDLIQAGANFPYGARSGLVGTTLAMTFQQ